MSRRRALARAEQGESLVELLVSISILGLVIVIIIEVLFTMVAGTLMHREQVEGLNALGAWADSVGADTYTACATPGSVPSPPSLPNGFSSQVVSVRYWDGSSFVGECGTDTGLQLITLSVAGPGDAVPATPQALDVVKRKPCVSGC